MTPPARLPILRANEDIGTDDREVVLAPDDARELGLALVQAAMDERAVRMVVFPEPR